MARQPASMLMYECGAKIVATPGSAPALFRFVPGTVPEPSLAEPKFGSFAVSLSPANQRSPL